MKTFKGLSENHAEKEITAKASDKCWEDKCTNPHFSMGMCRSHYFKRRYKKAPSYTKKVIVPRYDSKYLAPIDEMDINCGASFSSIFKRHSHLPNLITL